MRRIGAQGLSPSRSKRNDMYMTTEDMSEHLYSLIRRIRIKVGDPTLGRLPDDAWLLREMRRSLVHIDNQRQARRRRSW